MAPQLAPKLTLDAYLALESEAGPKHEYINGDVIAMAGATLEHSRVQVNLLVALAGRLRGGPCQVHGSDLRVEVEATGLHAYPDLTVVCGEPELSPTRPPALRNPTVIVEVLSESTESWDTGAKAAHYRRLPSVRTLLFVDPRRRLVMRQDRNADGTWTLSEQADGEVRVLDVRVPMEEVYEGVRVGG